MTEAFQSGPTLPEASTDQANEFGHNRRRSFLPVRVRELIAAIVLSRPAPIVWSSRRSIIGFPTLDEVAIYPYHDDAPGSGATYRNVARVDERRPFGPPLPDDFVSVDAYRYIPPEESTEHIDSLLRLE